MISHFTILLFFCKVNITIEVKYKNRYTDKDLSGLSEFCRKFGCKKGILITKGLFDRKEHNGIMLLLIPIWMFLLAY